jgi:hypothetical protein
VSGNGIENGTPSAQRDPLVRFLWGCAAVVAVIVAIVICGVVLIGWRLGRDEAPGRPTEAFLVGDESQYWRADLKADDAGLIAFFARLDEINDATRREIFRGTFLEGIPIPHRRARLDELAPFSIELGVSAGDRVSRSSKSTSWAARGTFSRGVFRLRAAVKLIRFLASRDATNADVVAVDGVEVTEIRGKNAAFALATVGNRLLVANDASRMREVLKASAGSEAQGLRAMLALHDGVALPGEDAWALIAATRVGDVSRSFAIEGAAASFDVNARDELAFRVVVADAPRPNEDNGFRGDREDCWAVVAALLPGVPRDAVEIDGEGARAGEHGGKVFTGRIAGLSSRLAALVARVKGLRPPGTPFAIPSPSPPGEPADRRTDTPEAPMRGGNPKPPR